MPFLQVSLGQVLNLTPMLLNPISIANPLLQKLFGMQFKMHSSMKNQKCVIWLEPIRKAIASSMRF